MTRNVKDSDGRTWVCRQEGNGAAPGKDVSILCTTEGVSTPVRVTVSWRWAKMSENGLARLIGEAVPELAR